MSHTKRQEVQPSTILTGSSMNVEVSSAACVRISTFYLDVMSKRLFGFLTRREHTRKDQAVNTRYPPPSHHPDPSFMHTIEFVSTFIIVRQGATQYQTTLKPMGKT